jgi:hypothetical protein
MFMSRPTGKQMVLSSTLLTVTDTAVLLGAVTGQRLTGPSLKHQSIRKETGMQKPKYNKEAVDKAIKRDPRIKGHEAKLIHRLLKGRAR